MAAKLHYTKTDIMSMIKRRQQTRPPGPYDKLEQIRRLRKWQDYALAEWLEIGKRIFETPEIDHYFSYSPRHKAEGELIE